MYFPFDVLKLKGSKTELIRALDYLNLITNGSHKSINLNKVWNNEINDYVDLQNNPYYINLDLLKIK